MKPYLALAVFLASAVLQTMRSPGSAPGIADPGQRTCAGCFAYLVFPPSIEPEPSAMRGQATETSAPPPAASEPSGGFSEQTARLLASPKQQARTADLRPHPQTRIGAMTQHQPLLPARAARCNELRPLKSSPLLAPGSPVGSQRRPTISLSSSRLRTVVPAVGRRTAAAGSFARNLGA